MKKEWNTQKWRNNVIKKEKEKCDDKVNYEDDIYYIKD